jgi:hypothetical protein
MCQEEEELKKEVRKMCWKAEEQEDKWRNKYVQKGRNLWLGL